MGNYEKSNQLNDFYLLIELVDNFPSTQLILLDDLIYKKKYLELFYLVKKFNLWNYVTQPEIISLLNKIPEDKQIKDPSDVFGPVDPSSFKFPHKFEDVIFVDTKEKLEIARSLLNDQIAK